MCPDWEMSQQPFGAQGGAQPTELLQLGYRVYFCGDENIPKLIMVVHIHPVNILKTIELYMLNEGTVCYVDSISKLFFKRRGKQV